MFIALYGVNNVGKTTHATLLVQRLRQAGKKAVYIKYPIYDQKPTGPLINNILRSKKKQQMSEEELQLLFVLNRYQFQPKLLRLLKKGVTVIAEDYIGTGIAWGITKGAKRAELENMNKFLVQPDVEILLDGKRAAHAKEKKHIHEQNDRYIEKCQKVLRLLAKRYNWKKVTVATKKEATHERIWKIAARVIS